MTYASIEDLRSQLGGPPKAPELDPAYREKQLHPLPEIKIVDRVEFILTHVKGKRVLEFGASGSLHQQIKAVASKYCGVDRESGDHVWAFDLDDVSFVMLPFPSDPDDYPGSPLVEPWPYPPDIIVCGEVLEHLGNPLWFLTRLKRQYAGVPVIITVPNAFAAGSLPWLKKGIENVNKDHVAWYSPKTISVLLERAGYQVGELFYYNGTGPTAEGLVVVTE